MAEDVDSAEILALTAEIVSAHVGANSVGAEALPDLIRDVYRTIAGLGAAPPAPSGTFWLLWRYMALARLTGVERASGSLGPGAAPGASVPWPVPVIDFFHGNIDAATLLDFAKKSQDVRDLSQVCEAHFYMAEDALLRQRGDAIGLFRLAAKECPPNFHEYEGAVAELRAAGVPLTPPGPTVAAAAATAASAP